jgi:16S rRNA (adenine1518-N6/adenine1519-N6)-dimethyltransferase
MTHGHDELPTLVPAGLAPGRLLRALGLEARKGLGQNFLTSKSALQLIVRALDLAPDDTVVEVGAGLGALTGYLAACAGQVVAVELDEALEAYLREAFAGVPGFRLVHGDILELGPGDLLAHGTHEYKLVGNLPYYITSAALRHLLDWQPPPLVLVVMVQYEVAKRITARPGDMSLLALMVQLRGAADVVARVPAGAFVPAPKVDSAIVRIRPYPVPLASAAQEKRVFRLARAGFQQRRKMLLNSLSSGLSMPKAALGQALARLNIAGKARAEDLSVSQWMDLAAALLPVGVEE